VFSLQEMQLLAQLLQQLLNLPALPIHAVTLDMQQIKLPTDDGLPSQQRQQLTVIQYAVVGAMAG
jgi:hypothetical protein